MVKVNYEFRNGWHTFSSETISYSFCGDYKEAVEQLKRNYNLDDVRIVKEGKNAMVYSDVVEMIKTGEVEIPRAKKFTIKHLQNLIGQGFDIKQARFILIGIAMYIEEQQNEPGGLTYDQMIPGWLLKENYANNYRERIIKVR